MPNCITLYRAPTTPADADTIARWLDHRVDAEVTVEDRLLGQLAKNDSQSLPRAIAEARVLSPYDRETGNTMQGILRYEERMLEYPEREGGVLYDGLRLQDIVLANLQSPLDHLHIPLLARLIGTWGTHDNRWHKRVCVLGQPALISVPGLYEAPAKPEAYYKAKQSHALHTGDTPPREMLEAEIEGDFLIADDPRTTEALKGYVLAAYHLLETGEGFCHRQHCRLSNPHRQPDLIEAQLQPPEFCDEHAALYT